MTVTQLRQLVPAAEMAAIRRSAELSQCLADMAANIGHIPALYETDGNNAAVCQLHYFDIAGAADWYIYEIDQSTGEAFGFATLSGEFNDPCAEYGYIDLYDLLRMPRINLDLHFSGLSKTEINQRRYGVTAA